MDLVSKGLVPHAVHYNWGSAEMNLCMFVALPLKRGLSGTGNGPWLRVRVKPGPMCSPEEEKAFSHLLTICDNCRWSMKVN